MKESSPAEGASVGASDGGLVCLGFLHQTGDSTGAFVGLTVKESVGADLVGVLVGAGTKIV